MQIGTLTIPAVKKRDSGNYTCSPSNSQTISILLQVISGELSTSSSMHIQYNRQPTFSALSRLFFDILFCHFHPLSTRRILCFGHHVGRFVRLHTLPKRTTHCHDGHRCGHCANGPGTDDHMTVQNAAHPATSSVRTAQPYVSSRPTSTT